MMKRTIQFWKAAICLLLFLNAAPFFSQETDIPEYIPLDIDYPDHPLVLKYHSEYTSNYSRKWLKEVMERATPYRPYIRQKLAEAGLPLCLEYLPVIESNYNPRAVSKSGAVGLWQFMENSISGLLKKDSWQDERLDPWLSTDAAIKKLSENYNYFHDWGLALAAYNMGLGGLRNIMKKSGKSTIWELIDGGYLKTETSLYFPKFLAIADLLTNPEYYELDVPAYDETMVPSFSVITTPVQISLSTLSEQSGVPLETLMKLNPALKYQATPFASDYTFRVPAGTEEVIQKALESAGSFSADVYTVIKGDTLWGISRRYGITVADLCTANNISENGILRIGTKLFVPIIK